MKNIVSTVHENCVGCNRCLRACPIEQANIVYLDDDSNIKVKIDHTHCIACGLCLSVCKHSARVYTDDVNRFFDDLVSNIPISIIVAPSIRTNFPEWKKLLQYFRNQGVKKIYDVSFGADICIWANIRYMDLHPGHYITQPCPAIVSYIEIYEHSLIPHLSPANSPMGCIATYMRKHEGITDSIAALSPCIAKANEFEELGNIEYNLTFENIQKFIDTGIIVLPDEESDFDNNECGLGSLFPAPGGLTENIEFFKGKSLRIDRSEGKNVYPNLKLFAQTEKELLPDIYDVLNCQSGCSMGTGCSRKQNIFRINTELNKSRERAYERDILHYEELFDEYDRTFELDDYLRTYTPIEIERKTVTDADLQKAFALLDKYTYSEQNFNCGACGANSCEEMARNIAMKVNLPVNCVIKSRDDTVYEHKRNIELYEKTTSYLALIRNIGNYILSRSGAFDSEIYNSSIQNIGTILGVNSMQLWRTDYGSTNDGTVVSKILDWPEDQENPLTQLPQQIIANWLSELKRVEHLNKTIKSMSSLEKNYFAKNNNETLLVIPILTKGRIWGFLTLQDETKRIFTDEEIAVTNACGILIASSIMEDELMQSLIHSREVADVASRAKSDFLSQMSHEIRTPMNAIIGMTKIAETSTDIDKIQKCLDTIATSSNHLLGLINNILDMSKIEADKFELNNAPFNLEKMLAKVSEIVTDKINQNNLQFSVVIGKDVHFNLIGDEMRLSQVITNLLSNSVKFTPPNGQITVTTNQIEQIDDHCIIRVAISDTGIGMTQEQMDKLFNPFQQADHTISSKYGGTGLGLAISKNIVEMMDGRIWVESTLDEGSTFIFEVKLKMGPKDVKSESIKKILPPNIKLFVVDDNDSNIRQLKIIARQFELPIDTASTSSEAIKMINNAVIDGSPYDVMFIDYDMPKMNGLDLISRLHKDVNLKHIVMMSSFIKWNSIDEDAREAGIVNHLTKPIFPSNTMDSIATVLGKELTEEVEKSAENIEDIDFSNVNILLVEDIEINRIILITLLEETNLNIFEAENGLIAVNMYKEDPEKYDLIIMDVNMPEMNGYDATRAIRSSGMPNAKDIPIIAMTANAFHEDVQNALDSGMNDHLTKPIDAILLVNKIMEYVKK